MSTAPLRRDPRISVVVLTHNRADELARSLRHLEELPERPRLIVVDNGSSDDTAPRVRRNFPAVTLVRCPVNRGAAGRNAGVQRVTTRYVAFCDDDTWWAPGALARASDLLDAHPGIGALSGRVLVGPEERLDPACARMASSPLQAAGLPGAALIAFMAGAAVMRTCAYREVGGYEARLFLGAEEQLMAFDLAARGWHMVYAAEVVTHHHPSAARDPSARRLAVARNRIWIAWMRLPAGTALRTTLQQLGEARAAGQWRPVLRDTLRGIGWALSHRKVVPERVHRMHRQVFERASPRVALKQRVAG